MNAAAAARHGHELKPGIVGEPGGEPGHAGKFAAAGWAPGAPEVEECDLARERGHGAAWIGECDERQPADGAADGGMARVGAGAAGKHGGRERGEEKAYKSHCRRMGSSLSPSCLRGQ